MISKLHSVPSSSGSKSGIFRVPFFTLAVDLRGLDFFALSPESGSMSSAYITRVIRLQQVGTHMNRQRFLLFQWRCTIHRRLLRLVGRHGVQRDRSTSQICRRQACCYVRDKFLNFTMNTVHQRCSPLPIEKQHHHRRIHCT